MERIPSFKEILAIAFPIMIGGISESISAIVDTAFMGKLGTLEIDGMGMTNTFLILVIMIGWSFGRSVQILVAQNYGAKKFENIGDIMFNAMILVIPIGFLLLFLLYQFNASLLSIVIHKVEILSIASNICKIRAYGFPVLMISLVISSFFTGIGKTKILICSQGVAAISNIILNYALVFGKWGFLALGYRGSAWATVVSEILGLLVLVGYMVSQSQMIKTYYLFYNKNINRFLLKEINQLAIPFVFLFSFSLGSWVYFFALIENMGEKELAASLIIKQIFASIMILGFSLATTSNTIVGQLVGSRNYHLILPSIFKVVKINYLFLLTIALLTFIFQKPIIHLFSSDIMVEMIITKPLVVLLVSFLFLPAANVIFQSVSALGNMKVPIIMEGIVISLYLLYLIVFIKIKNYGLIVAWYSEMFYWGVFLTICIGYFTIFDWKKNIIVLDKKNE